MSSFVPSKSLLRHSLLFLFHQKKKAVEDHRFLVENYGEHAPVIRTFETWFLQFKSGDSDLTDNEHPGAAKKFEDEELQALLDEHENTILEIKDMVERKINYVYLLHLGKN